MEFITAGAYPADDRSERRPVGVSLLAILCLATAASSSALVVACLPAPGWTIPVFQRLFSPIGRVDFSAETIGNRIFYALLTAGGAALIYLLARGLWQLENWARTPAIALFASAVMIGDWPSEVLPFSGLSASGPVFMLLCRLLSCVAILYLLSPQVRETFGLIANGRAWQYVACALTACVFVLLIQNSKTELNAIRWHRQYGNQISVNGVVFSRLSMVCADSRSPGESAQHIGQPGTAPEE